MVEPECDGTGIGVFRGIKKNHISVVTFSKIKASGERRIKFKNM